MPKVFYWMCSKSGFKHLKSISFIPLEYSFGKLPGEIFDWTFHNFATHATNQYTSWITCHSQGLLVRLVKKTTFLMAFFYFLLFVLLNIKQESHYCSIHLSSYSVLFFIFIEILFTCFSFSKILLHCILSTDMFFLSKRKLIFWLLNNLTWMWPCSINVWIS